MITCVHGFLGAPGDWEFLRQGGFDIDAISLDAAAALGKGDGGDTILGYSMGGRLALRALVAGASFRRAIIVSAGLNLEQGRDSRIAADEAWARRFEDDPWERVVADWNAQPLFGGRAHVRSEADFARPALASALRRYSPGRLEPLRASLPELKLPVLWIAGAHDVKYVDVAREAVSLLPDGTLWICPDAWHRVPWERPVAFVEAVRRFVEGEG